jgi:hypothetical protein
MPSAFSNPTILSAKAYKSDGSLKTSTGWGPSSTLTHLVGNQIQFRSSTSADKIAPGQYVTATIEVDVTSCGTKTWSPTPTAKQSNDYRGAGNDFLYIGASPLTTQVTGGGTIASIDLLDIPDGTADDSPVTATVQGLDSCGAAAPLTSGVSIEVVDPDDDTTTPPVSYSGGEASASITATTPGTYTVTASFGALTDSDSFTITAGTATALRVGPIPDEDPNQSGVQQEANDPFEVHVETLDQFGNPNAPVDGDTDVTLTVGQGDGHLCDDVDCTPPDSDPTVTIPDGETDGATFGNVIYSQSEYDVTLTTSNDGGLTDDESDPFDVLEIIVTATATPGQASNLNTSGGNKCDTDAVNVACTTIVLPNGAVGPDGGATTITLSEGFCDDGIDFAGNPSGSCYAELMVFLANLSSGEDCPEGPDCIHLYGDGKPGLLEYGITGSSENPKPFYIITEFDESLKNAGVPHMDLYWSKNGADDSYAKAEKCVKKGVVDDGVPSTVDGIDNDWFCNESESRQNDGDTVWKTLMYLDPYRKP